MNVNNQKIKNHTGLARAVYLPRSRSSPKQWMNYLANLLHLYTASAPWWLCTVLMKSPYYLIEVNGQRTHIFNLAQ